MTKRQPPHKNNTPGKRISPALEKLAPAVAAGEKRDYKKAAGILGKIISESDAPPEAWLLLGRSFHALKSHSKALAAFNDYLKLRPRSSQGYLFAGRSYLALDLPYKAVPFLRKALEFNPSDPNAAALLGTAYLKSKHSQAAVDTLQAAVEMLPGSKRIYRAYLNALFIRGIRLCRLEDYDLGIQMLRFVLENGEAANDFPLIYLELGKACRERGLLEESLEHFTHACALAPRDRRIRWSRVSVLLALGKNDEARGEIDAIRGREPGVPELPWNSELVDLFLIRSSLEAGEWRKAADSCRAALKNRGQARGESAMIHAFYAEALRNLREYRAAHNHLQRAIEENPAQLEFRYADILVSWEGKDWKSLKKALRAAKGSGGDPDTIKRFSVLLAVRENDDEKKNLALLQEAVRGLGPDPELMYSLGVSNLKLGLIEQAQSWFEKTLGLKPDHEEAALGRIAALEAAGPGAPADFLRGAYDAYLERWPDNFAIRRERALYLVKSCEYTAAAAELEKLLVWEPGNPSLRRVLAYAYRKTGRYREAAVFLKALLRERPKDIELLLEYSGCLERTGASSFAAQVLEKASGLFSSSPELFLALGILSFRQKKIERAFDYLREAAALDKKDPRAYEWMAAIARRNGDSGKGQDYEREAQKRKKSKK